MLLGTERTGWSSGNDWWRLFSNGVQTLCGKTLVCDLHSSWHLKVWHATSSVQVIWNWRRWSYIVWHRAFRILDLLPWHQRVPRASECHKEWAGLEGLWMGYRPVELCFRYFLLLRVSISNVRCMSDFSFSSKCLESLSKEILFLF